MSPRRVVFFINTLVRGGTERNVTVLCKHMDRSRYRPEVWTLHSGGENEEAVRAAGVEIHCLNRGRSFSPMFALRAAREIARSDADLFHVFLPAIMFYVGLSRMVFRAGQPIVYSEATSLVVSRWQQPLRAWIVSRQCTGYAANSDASRAFLGTYGIPLEKIQLIPNGHEIDQFRSPLDRQAVRASLGVGPQDRLAVFVGRLVDTKRVCDLIEATRQVRAVDARLRVAIVGDGPERAALQSQALGAGLQDNVQFLGMRRDVVDLLRSADLFVFPSEMEGLSNAVIEAALAGLPIVGCHIGGVRDVVESGRESLLVAPRDPAAFAAAMRSYLADDTLACAHGAAARRRAENAYAIENTLERLYKLYDQVLGTHS
jgi:glycosyltransferase involved in cell wall biosynthesis